MIVCHCHALTDRDIRDVAGACGGCPETIRQQCGAGSTCGGCKPHVESIARHSRVAAPKTAARPANNTSA